MNVNPLHTVELICPISGVGYTVTFNVKLFVEPQLTDPGVTVYVAVFIELVEFFNVPTK